MKRTQISLTAPQFKALKNRAEVEGRSMADVVRELVERYLHPKEGAHRPLIERLAGIAKGDGRGGETHDELYDEPD